MEKVWNGIKGVIRVAIRIIVETLHRGVINIFDTLFGFLNWPKKILRVKIFILQDPQTNAVVSPADLDFALEYAKRSFKKNFNTRLLPYKNKLPFVEVLKEKPPHEALYTKGSIGALGEEFKIAGSFFASNLSGLFYPVTAFIVLDIDIASGCSLGPLADYVTLNPVGAKNASTLVHEIAHACGLWHQLDKSNLLWRTSGRGDEVKWWQKNIFRSSRHVTYW
ncbi:MAG TPA: hypothetical protein VGQ04_10730 [Chitinophagaceae bacterium]|jgi:hypothetical protein|nr:hypothetical protein [Chitinophagaceae bacterium]